MRSGIWALWLLLVVGLSMPAVVLAQEESGDDEAVTQQENSVDEEVQGDEEQAEPDGDASEVSEEDAADEEAAAEGEEAPAGDDETEGEETVEGPGGRELRTDYPGTEESLRPRMETSRIEGVDVAEGEDPDEVYDLRVRELETEIDDLKERVFRSKSRIALLRETILSENLAGSRAVVSYENELGRTYQSERLIFSVDGSQVFSDVDLDRNFARKEAVEVFTGPMAPGTHTVSVNLGMRGSGFGIFSYAEGYEFDLRFSCQFTAEQGRTTLVTVRTYESGNVFTAHEDRPDGICEVSMVELNVEDIEDDDIPMPE